MPLGPLMFISICRAGHLLDACYVACAGLPHLRRRLYAACCTGLRNRHGCRELIAFACNLLAALLHLRTNSTTGEPGEFGSVNGALYSQHTGLQLFTTRDGAGGE